VGSCTVGAGARVRVGARVGVVVGALVGALVGAFVGAHVGTTFFCATLLFTGFAGRCASMRLAAATRCRWMRARLTAAVSSSSRDAPASSPGAAMPVPCKSRCTVVDAQIDPDSRRLPIWNERCCGQVARLIKHVIQGGLMTRKHLVTRQKKV